MSVALLWLNQKTYLLALSLGGMIAIDFTLEYPDMVDALILIGTPIPGYPVELMFTQQQLQEQMQHWASFGKAMRERNIPVMVACLMADHTLMPSVQYPTACKRVRENLLEYSTVCRCPCSGNRRL